MVTNTLDWDDIRFFLELTERRTLSATARALRVTHVTVARRLASLETVMGIQLFERRPDGYALTIAGQRLHGEALGMRRVIAGIESVRDSSRDGVANGKVRITATRAMADLWLAERIAEFRAQYPHIVVDLLGTDRNLSLANREADLALRLARPTDGELVVRRISTLGFAFYATPRYLSTVSPSAWQFIGYGRDSEVPEAVWMREAGYAERIAFATNSLVGQQAVAQRGGGVALLPCYVGNAAPSLVRASLPDGPPSRDLWMVLQPNVARMRAVRTMINHLVAAFEEDAALFHGGVDPSSGVDADSSTARIIDYVGAVSVA